MKKNKKIKNIFSTIFILNVIITSSFTILPGKVEAAVPDKTVVLNYTQTILTEGTSWVVPADWDSANNTIEVIGGGGAGFSDTTGIAGAAGGGGGAYSKITNQTYTPGQVITYQIGAGGKNNTATGGAPNGGDTYFNGSGTTCSASTVVCAKGGLGATNQTGAAGGASASGYPTSGGTRWSGGAGGNGGNATSQTGGGGGGAGGPNSDGRAGGAGYQTAAANGGGGGGGGAGNGSGTSTVGSTGTTAGVAGGAGSLGTGGGSGGSGVVGGSGTTSGAGGGSGDMGFNGGHGYEGTVLSGGVGPGGGGGGAGDTSTTVGKGGDGGLYGGGGGGGRYGGRGAPGVIVITYGGGTATRTSWKVPEDWTSTNTIETWGAGGSSNTAVQGSGEGGGGGGAYSKITNLSTLTPGGTATYQIGKGGRTAYASVTVPYAGVNGGDTFFNGSGTVCDNTGATQSVCAQGGKGPIINVVTGGAGGAAASGYGTTEWSGGAGGAGHNTGDSGGGGGGAGGSTQDGKVGGIGMTSANGGGGGGGGAGDNSGTNSTVGSAGVAANGGAGGAGPLGTGAGTGGANTFGGDATAGGAGGGGGDTPFAGGEGYIGDLSAPYGGGGGGGVGDTNSVATGNIFGGDGGFPAAGGGGGLSNGFGANGAIKITYTPACMAYKSGNWSDTTIWSNCGGSASGVVPSAGENVVIASKYGTTAVTVTMDSHILAGSALGNVTVFGTLTTSASNYTLSASSINIKSGGTLLANNSPINLTGTSGTLFTENGTFTAGNSTFNIISASGTPTISSGAPTFYNLTLNSPGTKTLVENMTIGGALTITQGTLDTGATFTLSVTGTTSVTGTLSQTGSGTKTYTGLVTVNSGGSITSDGAGALTFTNGLTVSSGATFSNAGNAALNFGGPLTNNTAGELTMGTGITTFTASTSLAGTSGLIFDGAVAINSGFTLTNLNTGTITFSSTLNGGSGTSVYINGDATHIGYTKFGSTAMSTGVLTPASTGNTIEYTGATPTCKAPTTNNYYNLIFSGASGAITCSITAITNNLSSTGGNTWTMPVTTIGGALALSGTTQITTGAGLTVTGATTIGDGTSLILGAYTFRTDGNMTVGGGTSGTFNATNGTGITFKGDLQISAGSTYTKMSSGTVTFSKGAAQSITDNTSGCSTAATSCQDIGTVVTATASTNVTASTNIELNSLNIVGSTTWNITNKTMAISGAGTALTVGGTFTTAGSTVQYINATSATVTATTFENLTLGDTGTPTYTMPGTAWTINGNLVITEGATITKGAGVITFNGSANTKSITGNTTNSDLGTISIGNGSVAKILQLASDVKLTAVTITNGATLDISSHTLSLTGTGVTLLTATGTFSVTTGTVDMIGNGAATVNTGTPSFYNLTSSGTGTKTLGTGLTVTNTLTLSNGTFDTASNAVSAKSLVINGGTFTPQNSTVTLTGTGTVFNYTSGTYTASGETIKLTDTSIAGKTFAGGGQTFYNLWLAPGAGTGSYTISGDNHFNDFKDDGTGAHTINFTALSTTYVNSLTLDTVSVANITLQSTNSGVDQWNIVDSAGVNTVRYVTINDSNASGGADWDAYTYTADNTNGVNNTVGAPSWVFVAAVPMAVGGSANGNSGATVRVAINGAIDTHTTTISGGTWNITGITKPAANSIFTVWIQGVTDDLESTAVTKWSTGDITGMVLNTNVLTIGSNQNTSVSVTNLGLCDANTGTGCTEDIMHTSDSGTLLVQGTGNTYTDETLSILGSNTLTVASAATESITSKKITNAGVITATGTPTISINGTTGTLFTNSGTFTAASSTVNLSGNGDATINSGSPTFYNLTSSGTGLKTLGAAIGIATGGTLSVTNGTFSPSTYLITGSGTNTLNVGASGTIRVVNTNFADNYSAGFTTKTLIAGSTVDYFANGAQTIDASLSYSNLKTSTSGNKTLGGPTTVGNVFTIGTGTTFYGNNTTLGLSGTTGTPLVVTGSFVANGSTITFSGNNTGGNTTIPNVIYFNIVLDNTAETYVLASGGLSGSGVGALTINNGILDTTGNNYPISIGKIEILNSAELKANGSTITLNHTVGPLITKGASATFTYGTSTVIASANQAVNINTSAMTFYNLTVSNANAKTLGAAITIATNGTLSVTGGIFDPSTYLITGSGNNTLSVASGATIRVNTLTFALNYSSGFTTRTLSSGSTVDYFLNGAQTIDDTLLNYYNLTTSSGGTKTLGGSLAVGNVLTIGSGTTLALSTYTLTLSGATGTPLVATGSFQADTGTVAFTGNCVSACDTTIPALAYSGLTVNNASEKYVLGGNLSTSGVLTITAGELDANSRTITLSGNNGAPFVNSGTFTPGTSTVSYTGNNESGNTTVAAASYNNLTINNGSEIFVLGGASSLAASGVLTITAGTFDPLAYLITGSGTNTLSVASGATLRVGASTFAGNYSAGFTTKTLTSGSTVDYSASGVQTILETLSYSNLTTSNSGGNKTLGGNTTVSNVMTIGTGSTLALGTSTLTLSGSTGTPFVATGILQADTGTVEFSGANGAGDTTIPNSPIYYNLKINNSGETFRPAGNITGSPDGTLTVSNGIFNTNNTSDRNITIGKINLANSSTFTANSSTISLNGTSGILFTKGASATFNAGTSIVDLTGATPSDATVATGSPSFSTLSLSGTGTKSLGEALAITSALNISAGTFNPSTYLVTGTGTNTLTVSNGATIRIVASTFGGNFTSFETKNLNSGSTVDYFLNGTQTIDNSLSYSNLTTSTGGTKTLGGSLSVGNIMTIGTGTTLALSTYTLTLSGATGTPLVTTGTLQADTGTVAFTGNASGNTTIPSNPTYYGLTVNNASETYTLEGDTFITGVLTITAGTLDANSRTITLSGTTGTPFVNSGTFTPGTSTVSYTGNNTGGNTTVAGTTYKNLTLNASETFVLGGAASLAANGIFTVSAGTFNPSSYLITGNGTNTLTVASGATLQVGASTFAGNYSSGFAIRNLNSGSTVDYSLNGAQVVDHTLPYYNLTISTGGIKTLGGITTVLGTATITGGTMDTGLGQNYGLTASAMTIDGGTLTARNSVITLTGDLNIFTYSSGTINAGASTFKLNSESANSKTFAGNGRTFYNLLITGQGTGDYTITGSNIFNDFKVEVPPARTIKFEAGSTQTVNSWSVYGYPSHQIVLRSTVDNNGWTIFKASGIVESDYINIIDNIATGGATFYGGANSQNTRTSGWTFSNGRSKGGGITQQLEGNAAPGQIQVGGGQGGGVTLEQCSDGIDNDSDSLIDFYDLNCHSGGNISEPYVPTWNSETTSPGGSQGGGGQGGGGGGDLGYHPTQDLLLAQAFQIGQINFQPLNLIERGIKNLITLFGF